MLADGWTWLSAVPVVLVALVLLWLPGTLLASGLGAGRWPSLALAPVLTTSLVGAGGILCEVLGLAWGWGPLLVVGVLLPGAVWALRLLAVRSGRWVPELRAPVPGRQMAAGALVAAVVAVATIVRGIERPGDFPQMPDVIFHLSLVRHFLETGSISSVGADMVNAPSAPASYPAAFHGIVATLVMITGAPVVIAEQSVLLLVSALVWPLGAMLLASAALGRQRGVVAVTGFVATTIPGFPFLLHNWGGLWPLQFSFGLVAAVVATIAVGVRCGARPAVWWSAGLLVVAALPGLTLGHPGATFAAAYAGLAVAIAAAWTWGRNSAAAGWVRWGPFAGLWGAGVAFVLLTAAIAPVGMRETSYDRGPLVQQLIGQLTLWGPKDDQYQVFGGIVMTLLLVGAARALVSRNGAWLVAAWAGFTAFGLVTRLVPATETWVLTWPWYNLPVRIQAVAAILGVPLVGLGAAWLLASAGRSSRFLHAAALAALGVVVAMQGMANATTLSRYYALSGQRGWLSAQEARILTDFSATLPDDAVVAANPWRGGSFLYLLGPEDVLIHTYQAHSADLQEIGVGLDRVLSDPEVCAAVQRQDVTHVITGGDPTSGGPEPERFGGIDDVSPQEGFVVVEQADPYTLWKVPDCTP